MSGFTSGALVLVVLSALLNPLGRRLVDWLIPRRFNHWAAAAVARVAIRLARTGVERQEAQDALANVLAPRGEGTDLRPLGCVFPVLTRCLVSQFRRSRTASAYRHTNSKGVTYYLNSKNVTLVGGEKQTIYYFSKDERRETACFLPTDLKVEENPRNGFLQMFSRFGPPFAPPGPSPSPKSRSPE